MKECTSWLNPGVKGQIHDAAGCGWAPGFGLCRIGAALPRARGPACPPHSAGRPPRRAPPIRRGKVSERGRPARRSAVSAARGRPKRQAARPRGRADHPLRLVGYFRRHRDRPSGRLWPASGAPPPPPPAAGRHAGHPCPPGLASYLSVTCAAQGSLVVRRQSRVFDMISVRRSSRGGLVFAEGAARVPKNGHTAERTPVQAVYMTPTRAGDNEQTHRGRTALYGGWC